MRTLTLTERQVGIGSLVLLTIGSAFLSIAVIFTGEPVATVAATAASTVLCGIMLLLYWKGWSYANYSVVLLTTILVVVTTTEPYLTQQLNLAMYVPPILALILTSPAGVAASGIIVFGGLLAMAGGQGVLSEPVNIILYLMCIGGMTLARHITDGARQRAEQSAEQARAALARAEAQSQELVEANELMNTQLDQQQQLLDLVATLETPAVPLAKGVLFAPIVGHIDTRRAQALTARLLEAANSQRARLMILDIAGVSVMDTSVAQAIVGTTQALRLLGCDVTLSGISAAVAMTLIHMGINLDSINTARSPQEALTGYLAQVLVEMNGSARSKLN